ncbi:hypothetical protein SteCoe_28217 [Stentor coeruleus]|uniref:Uncharacterized protein n=1 Tax=Stentor coeruleus TaxID=5963 RepID=A0A1R2B8P6_9CILI|nr:hypothetical protein SteCoe_28217 [Stentor coeruleus]
MDPLLLVQYTVSGFMPLVCLSMLGAVFAYKKIFTKVTIDRISASYSNFFNPVFVFFNVSSAIDINEISTIWPLFLTPSIVVILGTILAYIHSKICPKIPYLSKVVACILIFSNIGNMPVVLLKGICSPYGPLKSNSHCKDANSYISLQVLTYNAIVWSYGSSLVSQDKTQYLLSKQNEAILESNPIAYQKTSFCRNILKNLLLPGPIACVIALLFGLIPGVHSTFFNKNSKLYCIVDAGFEVGLVGILLGQMTLGANLVLLSGSKLTLSKGFIGSIIFFKNILMPICGFCVVFGVFKAGIFGDNSVMAYCVFIAFCSPTAFIIMMITQIHDYGTKEVAWMMFWVYLCALPTLIAWTYVFFLII